MQALPALAGLVKLDSGRRRDASRRAREALSEAAALSMQASQYRAKARALATTWDLCLSCYEPLPDDHVESGDAVALDDACRNCYVPA